jgi:hypothetical protein
MSRIVEFRERVCQTIRTLMPELEVEWYDGMFDEKDVGEWMLRTPCARVAVMNVPTKEHSTGEMNACLRVVVVFIATDGRHQRDGDEAVWEFIEKLAIAANYSNFGDPNAAPAKDIQFSRLSDPEMRRDGVTLGVVEWETGLMIGNNRARDREQVMFGNQQVTQTPRSVMAEGRIRGQGRDQLDVSPEE